MKFLGDAHDRVHRKVKKRMGRVTTMENVDWADNCLWAAQEALEQYRRSQDGAALAAAKESAVGLLGAIDALLDRE